MSEISSQDAIQEAADLLMKIAPRARSKAERRLSCWRKLAKHFSFYRISEIDRRSNRVVVSASELKILRVAAREGNDDTNQMARRLAALEADFAGLRALFERTVAHVEPEKPVNQVEVSTSRKANRGSDKARAGALVADGPDRDTKD